MAIARPFILSISLANPMLKIYLDLIEDLREDEDGNKSILVAIDAFSRYLSLYPLRNKTAVAKAFRDLCLSAQVHAL
jgi:hypothetical protein